jgi:Putative Actinobacterial Holin-X, holin superfamily III
MPTPTESATERPPLSQLLRDLTSDVSRLVRQEVALAKAEMAEKAARIGTHLAAIAMAGAVLIAAGLALLIAAIYGLTALFNLFLPLGVAVWLAPLVIAAGLGTFGYATLRKARQALSQESLSLDATAQSLQETKQWLSSRMH